MDINFYKYKRNFAFKHDIKLLDGGDYLKVDASTVETDSDGTIADVNLSERQDEKVNLLYNSDVKLRDISNKSEFQSDIVYRVKSRRVTTHIDAVSYGNSSESPTLRLNKNDGIDNTIPDFTSIPLKPAHQFLQSDVFPINRNIIRISAYENTMVTVYFDDALGLEHQPGNTEYEGSVATLYIEGTELPILNGNFDVAYVYVDDSSITINDTGLASHILRVGTETQLPNITEYSIDINTGVAIEMIRDYSTRGVIIDRELFATAGIWTNSNYDLNMSKNKSDKDNRSPYGMSKKTFDSRLNILRDSLKLDGVDVIVTEYTEKYVKLPDDEIPIDITDKPWIKAELDTESGVYNYFDDIHYSFIDRYKTQSDDRELVNVISKFGVGLPFTFNGVNLKRTSFADSIVSSTQFIERLNARDELLPLPSDEVSPFDCSIKEIVMSIVGTADELYSELNELYDDADKANSSSISALGNLIDFGDDSDNVIDRTAPVTDNYDRLSKISNDISSAFYGGLVVSALVTISGSDLRSVVNRLGAFISKAKWFEKYAGESILPDGKSIDGENTVPAKNYHRSMARFLVPVDMGTKTIKKQVDGVYGKKTIKIKKDMGVRWVEVKFTNTEVYSQYRPNEIISGIEYTGLSLGVRSVTMGSVGIERDIMRIKLTNPQYLADVGTKVVIDVFNSTENYSRLWKSVDVIDAFTLDIKVPWSVWRYAGDVTINPSDVFITRMITPYPATSESGDSVNVRVDYNIPHLPFDDELRNEAFITYGPFDQSENAVRWNDFKKYNDIVTNVGDANSLVSMFESQEGTSNNIPGYEIFKSTSKLISDMRHGIGIYDKVQFLKTILETEFGVGRVTLTETVRSIEDQDVLQLGGTSSNFLSWHNYGLAVKFVITESNGRTPIIDGSSDCFKLLNIAEAIHDAAISGKLGVPCNIIWGGQLVTGPDLFVWEFLPIGISHKDAKYLRDSIYNQIDPIDANAFVNVSASGYLMDIPPNTRITVPNDWSVLITGLDSFVGKVNDMTEPTNDLIELVDEYTLMYGYLTDLSKPNSISDYKEFRRIYREFGAKLNNSIPYILNTNVKVNSNSVYIDSDVWVSPKAIHNYTIRDNLVLKDIQEFLYMIRRKFDANGTSLIPDQTVMSWKLGNPISYKQLLLFNALTGSFDVCRSLLASDYVTKFESLIGIADRDPVKFVKRFLGLREYRNIKLYTDGSDADGAFITLHNGKLSVPVLQCRSTHSHAHGNLFGEKQLDFDHMEYGQVIGGVFTPEYNADGTKNELVNIESTDPVIAGFDYNGNIIPYEGITDVDGKFKPASDALWLHVVLKDKIVEEYKNIKSTFDGLSTNFLHDRFDDSPNSTKLLENEFGIISTQDIMTFDQLRDMYRTILINQAQTNADGSGNNLGIGNIDVGALTPEDNALLNVENRNRDQSIYEKLISTAQLTGIQFSRITKEKPEIEPLQTNRLEAVIKKLSGKGTPEVTDIL